MARKRPRSLRTGVAMTILLCWMLPVIIVTVTAGVLVNVSYNRSLKQSVDTDVESSMDQLELRLTSVIEDSKAVSYDGVVRRAWQNYKLDGTPFFLYRDVTEYLSQKFGRNSYYKAAFISFTDGETDVLPYATAPGSSDLALLRAYTENVLPAARELLSTRDTGLYFMVLDGELYTVRNLLDSSFEPYAVLVIGLDSGQVFQSLYHTAGVTSPRLTLDGVEVPVFGGQEPSGEGAASYTRDVDGHLAVFSVQVMALSFWNGSSALPLRIAIGGVALLVIPLLIITILLFRRHVSIPIDVMTDADTHVERGERGYQIKDPAPNREFTELYAHFNAMSSELKSQFDRLYLEQQALQQARIKALQSQINPHFLNNTLEIINWEARLAGDERVSRMIEAMSTMLDAAIGRDGRSQAELSEELKYVDAYLTITKERLGDRLVVKREIDPGVEERVIPLLILQPLVENAVEHDLSSSGGELVVRAYERPDTGELCLEAEHDGSIPEEGWASIRMSLQSEPSPEGVKLTGASVGIGNVHQRLRLLYGESFGFTIDAPSPGRILARIVLPPDKKQQQ